jgi:hypothetical protein
MTWNSYVALFDDILTVNHIDKPYTDPAYINFVKLNKSRQRRWLKQGELIPELQSVLKKITHPQHWILITEPWCGDSAHNAPFLYLMSELSEHIELEVQLRDSAPFLIEDYLSNGARSIPKLIVIDENGKDLFTWGARPQSGQDYFLNIKDNEGVDAAKIKIQEWYNLNKGVAIQQEFSDLLSKNL